MNIRQQQSGPEGSRRPGRPPGNRQRHEAANAGCSGSPGLSRDPPLPVVRRVRHAHVVGPAFMLNAVGGTIIAVLLVTWRHWIPLPLAVGFGASTLGASSSPPQSGFSASTSTGPPGKCGRRQRPRSSRSRPPERSYCYRRTHCATGTDPSNPMPPDLDEQPRPPASVPVTAVRSPWGRPRTVHGSRKKPIKRKHSSCQSPPVLLRRTFSTSKQPTASPTPTAVSETPATAFPWCSCSTSAATSTTGTRP